MNLTNLAVSALVANSISTNVMGLGLKDFLLAGSSMSDLNPSGWGQTGDPHNYMITLREIFDGEQSGSGIKIGDAITRNAKKNFVPLMVGVVGIPIIAKVVTKAIRKPIITPMNRMLKSTGLDVKV